MARRRRRNPSRKGYMRKIRHRRRSYRRNPGIVGRITSPIRQVFTKDTLMEGLQLGAGVALTPTINATLLSLINKREWAVGYTGYLTRLVSAGLLGAVAGMVLPARVARNLMLGGVVGVASDPSRMLFLMSSSAGAILQQTIQGNNTFYGGIYGPEATFTIQGNAEIFGAVIAREVNVTGNAEIHYDERLSTSTTVPNVYQRALISWRELN